MLYPYRPTALKNRQRWNFGTLYPRAYAQAQRPEEPFRMVAECLAVANVSTKLDVRLRFLHLEEECTSEHANLRLDHPFSLTVEMDEQLRISLRISAQKLEDDSSRIRVEVQNTSRVPSGATAKRAEALPFSLVSAHLLLGLTGGRFVSLLDPGERYSASAKSCANVGVFPVLMGEGRSMMLCSPIILYDYPQIAPESAGDFFDGTEMDEMLNLRVLTLSDAEKQEMRRGDPRARRILERTEALSEEDMLRVHGVFRELRALRGAS
jgi:hypothetical protein